MMCGTIVYNWITMCGEYLDGINATNFLSYCTGVDVIVTYTFSRTQPQSSFTLLICSGG